MMSVKKSVVSGVRMYVRVFLLSVFLQVGFVQGAVSPAAAVVMRNEFETLAYEQSRGYLRGLNLDEKPAAPFGAWTEPFSQADLYWFVSDKIFHPHARKLNLGVDYTLPDAATLTDLDLVVGASNPAVSIARGLSSATLTYAGLHTLQRDLLKSLGGNLSVADVRDRKACVKELAAPTSAELYAQLDAARSEIARAEGAFVALWDENVDRDNIVLPEESTTALMRGIDALYYASAGAQSVNALYDRVNSVPAILVPVVGKHLLLYAGLAALKGKITVHNVRKAFSFAVEQVPQLRAWFDAKSSLEKGVTLSFAAGAIAIYGYMLRFRTRAFLAQKESWKSLVDMTREHKRFFDGAETLARFFQDSLRAQALLSRYPDASFEVLLNPHHPQYAILKNIRLLFDELHAGSSAPGYFTTKAGKVYTALRMLGRIKNELVPLYKALGVMDVFVGMAKLTMDDKAGGVAGDSFCLADILESDTPTYKAKGVWSLLVGRNSGIPSDFALGGDGVAKHAVISGPNMGGKSTFLRAFMSSITIAQAYGIAPADEFALTPFTRFGTYANIVDNVADGNSLFGVEVLRATSLLEKISSLKPHEKMVVIVDELFRGTEARVASSLSQAYIEALTRIPNCMVIFASHYPETLTLEERTNGVIKNFHIKALIGKTKIAYPYRLYEGATHQNIAFDLIRQRNKRFLPIVAEAEKIFEGMSKPARGA